MIKDNRQSGPFSKGRDILHSPNPGYARVGLHKSDINPTGPNPIFSNAKKPSLNSLGGASKTGKGSAILSKIKSLAKDAKGLGSNKGIAAGALMGVGAGALAGVASGKFLSKKNKKTSLKAWFLNSRLKYV